MHARVRRSSTAPRRVGTLIGRWQLLWAALLALSLFAVPHSAYAQDDVDVEALRQTVQFAATSVAQTTAPVAGRGSAAQVGGDIGSAESLAPPPGVGSLPDSEGAVEEDAGEEAGEPGFAQVPDEALPEQPSEPSSEEDAEEDAEEPAEEGWVDFENAGVSVRVPAAWETASDEETVFAAIAPDSDFAVVLVDIGDDIPSFIGLTLFRVAGENMLQEWIPDARTLVVEADFTAAQEVPMVRLEFDAEIEGEPSIGAFFVISGGSQAYVLLVAGTVEEFDRYAEEAEDILASLTFDPSLITYVQAEDGPLAYANADETLSVFVPDGWYAADTADEKLPVILMDPGLNFVTMLTTDTALGTPFDADMAELFDTEEGLLDDPALLDELAGELTSLFGASEDELTFDPTLTETFPREEGLMIRMVGEGNFGDGAVAPVIFYFDLRADGGALGMVVGEIEPALADEQALLDVVRSIDTPE